MVREVYENELSQILELYLHLYEETVPEKLNFYSNAGYNSTDKTAFIQWLE